MNIEQTDDKVEESIPQDRLSFARNLLYRGELLLQAVLEPFLPI